MCLTTRLSHSYGNMISYHLYVHVYLLLTHRKLSTVISACILCDVPLQFIMDTVALSCLFICLANVSHRSVDFWHLF